MKHMRTAVATALVAGLAFGSQPAAAKPSAACKKAQQRLKAAKKSGSAGYIASAEKAVARFC